MDWRNCWNRRGLFVARCKYLAHPQRQLYSRIKRATYPDTALTHPNPPPLYCGDLLYGHTCCTNFITLASSEKRMSRARRLARFYGFDILKTRKVDSLLNSKQSITMKKIIVSLAAFALLAIMGGGIAFAVTNPLLGKIIALDAGHGSSVSDTGAVNQKYGVAEADVNLSVVNALKPKLEGQGVKVVVAARLSSRKDRINDVIAKCAEFDLNNDGVGDKCNALVSVHHNGSADANYDGTLVIYNEKKDKSLAEKLLAALTPLTGKSDGLENGGYGMTVYGNLISVITEAYFITNDAKASRYLNDLNADGISNLVIEEADMQVKGISDYFASQTSGGGGKPR